MPARTGSEYLQGLRDDREIWLDGERVSDVTTHPKLCGAAHTVASLLDLQHEYPDTMLGESPETGDQIGITHMLPRSREDLERRRHAMKLWADRTGGMMGRTPDYLNVTFACFAGRSDVWARRGNERGAVNIVRYQREIAENDLVLTHTLINPQVDRSVPDAEAAMGEAALHKVGETEDSVIVRGARMLATLAPFADELAVYPGSPIRLQDDRYALCFAVPVATPGLSFICRDSFTKNGNTFDCPLSSRFDEMDAVVIFDDVHVPKERVFLDGDTIGHTQVITDTHWRAHIIQQAMTRAWAKLEFAFGLGHAMAEATGVNAFDHIQEKLGEIWSMLEMTRAGVVAAEAESFLDEGGLFTPEERPFVALRGLMPKWIPRAYELLQLIGGGGFMCTPSSADFDAPIAPKIAKYFQARNASAEERVRLFRLAWDFVGSDLGGRGELYERFYLSDSFRMTALAYLLADKDHPLQLVRQFMEG